MADDQDHTTARPSPFGTYTPPDPAAELDHADAWMLEAEDARAAEAGSLPLRPIPLVPIRLQVSGLYEWHQRLEIQQPVPVFPLIPPPIPTPVPTPIPTPIPRPGTAAERDGALETAVQDAMQEALEAAAADALLLPFLLRETLRLDVDGHFPQMTASGTIYRHLTERTHWIARLTRRADGSYDGPIWYRNGDVALLPYTRVRILPTRSFIPSGRRATVIFSGGAATTRTRVFQWSSSYFRPCELEFDTVVGTTGVTWFDTHSHPTRPAALPNERVTIEKVFQRAGFNVTRSGDSPIPITGAGTNARWSDAEMHDAMQLHWSRFADRPQWAVWTLFAALSESGTSLGGIMFDDIGPNHRQGTAVFADSFIATPPGGDPSPAAWVQRMRFWTAVHELGHTFNLAHSWQKVHPSSWGTSWIPLANEPEARSFMNYPYNVAGGQAAFFNSFLYRFSDQELLFMRHAPERFVQQGNAAWFQNHGFTQVRANPDSSLAFELRVNHGDAPTAHAGTYQFLDQVVIELKLRNVGTQPILVDQHLLESADRLTVALKRENGDAHVFDPFATFCWHGGRRALQPGEAVYASLYLSAGRGGWYLAEPGRYVVQAALHLPDEDVVSNPLALRILPPRGYEQEAFAQDLFTQEVGRVLAFDGTQSLTTPRDVLQEAVTEFPDHPIATHARVALAMPLAAPFRVLHFDMDGDPRRFVGREAQPDDARALLGAALGDEPETAARLLGHIDYADYATRFVQMLQEHGEAKAASAERRGVEKVLASRGVKPAIIEQLRARMKANGDRD